MDGAIDNHQLLYGAMGDCAPADCVAPGMASLQQRVIKFYLSTSDKLCWMVTVAG